jgi:NAD(P)-dependent dehydrogenase (short-subunit alcohol dehydrogenase family)
MERGHIMRDFEGKVAVVTGAASGIGRGMAETFAAAGMKVVLADVEDEALAHAERVMTDAGAHVIAVKADVRKATDVEALAERAYAEFGAVHVLCNNAGVGAGGLAWEQTVDDWTWVLGVNLWGVIHGVRAFVPRMIAGGEEGHVVNTASIAGLSAGPFMASYYVSKFGVVALSESMQGELTMLQSKLKVSVLCPGYVNTNITDSRRNRPAELAETLPQPEAPQGGLRDILKERGLPPIEVGRMVLDAIREERFYVLTTHDFDERLRERMENVLERRNPAPPSFAPPPPASAETSSGTVRGTPLRHRRSSRGLGAKGSASRRARGDAPRNVVAIDFPRSSYGVASAPGVASSHFVLNEPSATSVAPAAACARTR